MTYLHGHQVEVVVINWKRPDNVAQIVRALKRQTVPCTVTVCDCHNAAEFAMPRAALPYIDRIYRWRHNLGAYSRYVPLGAYDHKYTFFLDDDMLPGTRCVEHFWQHAEQVGAFGALGQQGRIADADGGYRPQDIPRGPGFTEVDILVRAFFVPTESLIYVPQIRAMLGESNDPEDDILLALGLAMQAGLACYLTPADPDRETLANRHELASPHARYTRPDHLSARSRLLRSAVGLGWQPIRARARPTPGGSEAPQGERGVLYLAIGDDYRQLALASIASLRRYGYDGPVRVVTDQSGWLPPELRCEPVVPGPGGLAARHYKTQLVSFAYDLTLFLDADAIPVDDIGRIWGLLADGDIAMSADAHRSVADAITMNRRRDWWKDEWGDEYQLMMRLGLASRPYFNSGLILFRPTATTARLFRAWHEEWQRYGKKDQMALVRAVAMTAAKVRPLPVAWNCEARHFASIRDAQNAGVKVLHFLSANRKLMTPRLLSALSDQIRYPAGGPWESWDLGSQGQRFGAAAHGATPGGSFAVWSASGSGEHLEVVVPSPLAGVHHYWRDRDAPLQSWNGPVACGQSVGQVDAVSLVQCGRDALDMVVRAGDKLAHFWRERAPSGPWHGPGWVADGLAGNPSLVLGSCRGPDRLDLVVPCSAGGVAHLRGNHDQAGARWTEPAVFACELGRVDAVTLMPSTFGGKDRLDVIIRAASDLAHYWRPAGADERWHGPEVFFSGATGIPSVMQNGYGRTGGFELLTPWREGGMAHLWRDNDAAGRPWQLSAYIDRGGPLVQAVCLLPGNADGNRPGDLVAVARLTGETRWYWRQDRLRCRWLSVSLW